jgi:hypothetical protein
MSTLKYRQQKRERIQKEIVSLEKTISLKFTILSAIAFSLISVPVEILVDTLIDKTDMLESIRTYDYTKLIPRSIFWFCFHYFWMVRGDKKEIDRKKEELKEVEKLIQEETGTPLR